ncbi:MAG: hypothetical protein KC443_14685, partial [Anaerolineales bacterium]|nr:hypothetical protein [Anaerolineales bacterium]
MVHGSGWFAYLRHDEEQDRPAVTRELLLRVWHFAQPYQWQVVLLLVTIMLVSGLSLVSPLLFRMLIDTAIPERNLSMLNWLALGMVGIPVLNGVIGVWQRQLNSAIG